MKKFVRRSSRSILLWKKERIKAKMALDVTQKEPDGQPATKGSALIKLSRRVCLENLPKHAHYSRVKKGKRKWSEDSELVMKRRGACNDGERKGSFKSWQFLVYVIGCASKFVCALVAQSLHSIENSIWNRTLTWIWDRLVSNLEFVEVRKRRKMSSSDRTVKEHGNHISGVSTFNFQAQMHLS